MVAQRLPFGRRNPRARRSTPEKPHGRKIACFVGLCGVSTNPDQFAESDEARERIRVVPVDARRQIRALPLFGGTCQAIHLSNDTRRAFVALEARLRLEVLPVLQEAREATEVDRFDLLPCMRELA